MKLISYVNFVILTLVPNSVLGQSEMYPKNLSMAVKVLQATTSDSLQLIVRSTDARKLFTKLYPSVKQFKNIDNWTQNDENTGVSNYLKKKGVSYSKLQRLVIITAFKERLSGESLNEDMLLKPFRQTEIKWRTEDQLRYEADSLRGIYIPKDLSDCLEQINKLWPDSVKFRMKKMAEDDFIGVTHLGMGMWIRNNWNLWGGSRLVKWFQKLGITNAEYVWNNSNKLPSVSK